MHLFLIGGGRDPEGSARAHAPFVAATRGARIVVLLLGEEGAEPERWPATLVAAGAAADGVDVLVFGPERGVPDVAGYGAVYVAGGTTPAYADCLAGRLRLAPDAVYAGFSAGAAIAARNALVGGWRAPGGRPVCEPDFAEGRETVTLAPGLGLLDALVEVHATPWGTLPRLLAALSLDGAPSAGWAIDEHACLELRDGGMAPRVHGPGAVTRVQRDGGRFAVEVLVADG